MPRVVHADALEWQPSPTPHVWRKRLELSGPPESGRGQQRPSRGDPAARPESIFVLEAAFDDEYGSHPKGAWRCFPAGSSHTLSTESGCTLYVKQGHLSASPSA